MLGICSLHTKVCISGTVTDQSTRPDAAESAITWPCFPGEGGSQPSTYCGHAVPLTGRSAPKISVASARSSMPAVPQEQKAQLRQLYGVDVSGAVLVNNWGTEDDWVSHLRLAHTVVNTDRRCNRPSTFVYLPAVLRSKVAYPAQVAREYEMLIRCERDRGPRFVRVIARGVVRFSKPPALAPGAAVERKQVPTEVADLQAAYRRL
eukprot:7387454-Prymnesium_polylepis.1